MNPTADDPFQRRVLRNSGWESELSERGWVMVPLLNADEVATLRDFYATHAALGDINREGAYDPFFAEFTIMNSENSFRREAYEVITKVVQPRVAQLLVDYGPVVANYVNKPPSSGVVPVHQNMSMVDESVARSVSVWIALVDTDEENGTLQLVPRSHRAFRGRRGVWAYEEFVDVADNVIDSYSTTVSVAKGDAIILDDAAIHFSAPNRSAEPRLSIQYVMVPNEQPARYFELVEQRGATNVIDELTVDAPYFWDFWNGHGDRTFASAIAHREVARTRYSAEELQSRLDETR